MSEERSSSSMRRSRSVEEMTEGGSGESSSICVTCGVCSTSWAVVGGCRSTGAWGTFGTGGAIGTGSYSKFRLVWVIPKFRQFSISVQISEVVGTWITCRSELIKDRTGSSVHIWIWTVVGFWIKWRRVYL